MDSAAALVELIRSKAPEYLDLLTAEADADFEKAFNAILSAAVGRMERSKKSYKEMDEVGLTSVLASALSIPGLAVTQETHSNGHVDLYIVADHCVPERIKLGEAKIYKSFPYHVEGLKQLLGRYTTGRESRGILVVYVRQRNVAHVMQTLRERMDADKPYSQLGETVDHELKWSFISAHTHSCGEDLEVGHICCNLYVEPDAIKAS